MNVKIARDTNCYLKDIPHRQDINSKLIPTNKPKPGLSLAELENIPRNIRSVKQNYANSYYTNLNNPFTYKLNENKTSSQDRLQNNSRSGDIQNNQRRLVKNKSNSYLTIKSSRERVKSNQKAARQSPINNLYKSSGCHRYHTDVDFNYLSAEKFQIPDTFKGGKEKTQIAEVSNRECEYNSNSNWVKNISQNISSIDDEALKISNIDNDHFDDSKQFVKKSSKGVLSDVLDNRFSLNSPSKMKRYQDELLQAKTEEYKKGLLSKENVEDMRKKQNANVMNNSNYLNHSAENKNKIYVEDEKNAKLTVNLSYFGEDPSDKFIDGLELVLSKVDHIFEALSISQRLEKLLDLLDDHRRSIRLGSLVAIFIILKKYQIDGNLRQIIIEKILFLLSNYESQEELFLVACHEICSLFPKHELILHNINLICMFLTDFNFPLLQKSAFNCLMCMGYEGIRALVELASKDTKEYQQYILSNLLNTPHIQKIIIIRALLNEVYSNTSERRHSALAALNRMHDLISENETLTALSKFFNDQRIEKIFLSSTLRTAGFKGEKILLNEMKKTKDYSVRVAIASVLDYRVLKYPKYLTMRLDKNDAHSLTKNTPGKFCTYFGKVSPFVHEKKCHDQYAEEDEFLEVSTRDFLASLQRMLSMNYDHSNIQIVHRGSPFWLDSLNLRQYLNSKDDYNTKENCLNKYLNFLELTEEDVPIMQRNKSSNRELNERGEYLISEEVIKALCNCLKDYSTAVRDTSAGTLGRIGLPEGLLAIDQLVESIKDEDVNVKSKVIWTIGRISAGCDNSVIPYIVDALKSNMWKVKCACFFTLSQFGSRCARQAVSPLVKLLKESAINKQIIAETLVKLGNEGENTLITILNTETDANYKLKAIIAKSLALSNIISPNIDFIVESLFNLAKSNFSLVRQNSLFAIRVLAEKAEERVTYLKRKNLIPFYYEMMMDKEQAIQAYAISCIKSLGPQGELIFIEGLTKDSNALIRQNCAIGLCQMGPQTLRTLLIGLHDENPQVRQIIEKEILENFSVERIIEYFTPEKSSHRMSLKIGIREILEKQLAINLNTVKFLQNLLYALQNQNQHDVSNYEYEYDENEKSNQENKQMNYQ